MSDDRDLFEYQDDDERVLAAVEAALRQLRTLRENLTRVQEHLQYEVAQTERLRQLLTEYGRHAEGCSAAHGEQYRCRCGWREVEGEFPR